MVSDNASQSSDSHSPLTRLLMASPTGSPEGTRSSSQQPPAGDRESRSSTGHSDADADKTIIVSVAPRVAQRSQKVMDHKPRGSLFPLGRAKVSWSSTDAAGDRDESTKITTEKESVTSVPLSEARASNGTPRHVMSGKPLIGSETRGSEQDRCDSISGPSWLGDIRQSSWTNPAAPRNLSEDLQSLVWKQPPIDPSVSQHWQIDDGGLDALARAALENIDKMAREDAPELFKPSDGPGQKRRGDDADDLPTKRVCTSTGSAPNPLDWHTDSWTQSSGQRQKRRTDDAEDLPTKRVCTSTGSAPNPLDWHTNSWTQSSGQSQKRKADKVEDLPTKRVCTSAVSAHPPWDWYYDRWGCLGHMERFLLSIALVDRDATGLTSMLWTLFFNASTYADRDDPVKTRIEDYNGIRRIMNRSRMMSSIPNNLAVTLDAVHHRDLLQYHTGQVLSVDALKAVVRAKRDIPGSGYLPNRPRLGRERGDSGSASNMEQYNQPVHSATGFSEHLQSVLEDIPGDTEYVSQCWKDFLDPRLHDSHHTPTVDRIWDYAYLHLAMEENGWWQQLDEETTRRLFAYHLHDLIKHDPLRTDAPSIESLLQGIRDKEAWNQSRMQADQGRFSEVFNEEYVLRTRRQRLSFVAGIPPV